MISKKSQQTFKKTNVVSFLFHFMIMIVFFVVVVVVVDAVYTVYEKKMNK